ncbi:Tex-like N-terminal domain-containing protein [Enterobacter hormaechei]
MIKPNYSQELSVKPQQVLWAITLLDEGNTVPFVARYRKEVTGGLMILGFIN